jgi:RHS repeat-associated protein
VTDALNHTTTTVYDLVGNRTSVTDANQHATTYGYDEANHLTSVTDPRLKVTTYGYDTVGNLTSRTDANQHLTTFVYDLAHRMTSETRPLSRLWTYGYDANGNRTSIVDAIGNSTPQAGDGTTTFTYDDLDRLTGISYSDATPAVTFGYDGDGNRTSMSDPTQSTYTYDEVNRLKQIVRTGISQLDYTYDANGNVLTRAPAGGSAVAYTYDDDGRMVTAVSGGQTTSYAYDAAANEITATLPAGNGYVESRTYDNAGRLTEVKNQKGATILSKSTYTLDPVGNRSTIVTTTGATTLTYDADDRLTQACYTVACTGSDNFRRYTYDDVGNRLTEVSAAGTTTYTYDVLDQLVSSSGVGGNVSYTFNLDGDQTASGAQTMTYDLAHRLKTLTSGSTTTTYTYAGDGARVEASTGTQASKKTRFVWDLNRPVPELVRELDGNNALIREYQYGLDLLSMKSGSSTYYFHHDGLGSVTNLTSSAGVTQWTYDYHPFGVARTTTKNSNQAPSNTVQFAGEYLDATGLYYMRARQYAPSTGRFLSVDPKVQPASKSYYAAYAYSRDNPVTFVDPMGRDTGGVCITVAAGFIFFGGEQICVVVSGEFEIGLTATTDYGGGTPSASVTGGVQKSNATSINNLGGPFGYAGGSAGEGVTGGVEGFTGTDACGNTVTGANFSGGIGLKGLPGAEVHGGKSQTDVLLNFDFGGLFGDQDAGCTGGK